MTHRLFEDFASIEPEFRSRVDRMVWCAMATVDSKGRPSTRILHPNWEGQVGWIGTHRDSVKVRHLERNPHVSLAYISDVVHPVYVEATATWVDDLETRHRIWEFFKSNPEPVGFDPAPAFGAPDHENFGLLRIEPWKISMATLAGDPWMQVWRRD